MPKQAALVRLGRMAYADACAVQRRAHARRVAGRVPDVLFTVEHDPVFTRGRTSRADSFRASIEEVRRAGIDVVDTDRGGGVTYHGPGQVVAYPILDLREYGRDLHQHIHRLEEATIRTLAAHGVAARRREGFPGVWTDGGKIASLGVAVRAWVSFHGVAVNVCANEEHFAMIDPCGLPVRAVSICDVARPAPTVADVERTFVAQYGDLLDVAWEEWPASRLLEECNE